MADEVTDDELESILGDLPSSEDNLPDAEEPSDEEIQEVDEDLDSLAEDAPGVSPDDLDTGGDGASGDSDNEVEIEEEISLDDFAGDTIETEPDEGRPMEHTDTVLYDEDRQEQLYNDAAKAGASQQEAKEGMRVLDEMERNESMKSQIGFAQADNMRAFIDKKLWETFNYSSFGQFFEESDLDISRSAAYRYRNVALFMDEFPIGSEEFDDKFYEQSGIEKKEVVNSETGEVNEKRTREANSLTSRLNFTDVSEISGLYNNGHIDQAKARELLKKALLLPGSEFDEVVDMEREGKESTVTDELTNRGLVGPTFVVNAQNEEKAAEELRHLADEIESGKRYSRPVLDGDEGVEKLGSKSVSFHELQDGTIIGNI
jgi:hypothetical protein